MKAAAAILLAVAAVGTASAATQPKVYWKPATATTQLAKWNPQLWGKVTYPDHPDAVFTVLKSGRCVGVGEPVAGKFAAFRCAAVYGPCCTTQEVAQTQATVWFYAVKFVHHPMHPDCFSTRALRLVSHRCVLG